MIITKNLQNDFDDQILTYHKIIDCIVDNKTTDVVFVVGSWVSQETENEKPLFKTNINVHYGQWTYEYYNAGIETVMAHPDWIGGGPVKPDASYIWNPLTLAWVPPAELPLDDLKVEKWEIIKSTRNTVEFGGFMWNGYQFQSTQMSVIRIGGQVQAAIISKMMTTPFSTEWTLMDNTTITLTSDNMIGVSSALNAHINYCHNRSAALRIQLDAAKSSLQISEVNW